LKTSRQRPSHAQSAADLQSLIRHNMRLDQIVYRRVDDLKSYHRKLRGRSAQAQSALVASVRAFGLVLPILVDSKKTIISGEALVEAARTLGFAEVPTITLDHLDENEGRLLRIALNRLAEQADWNRVELGFELDELLKVDIDLDVEITGFSSIEIDGLIQPVAEAADDGFEGLEPLQPGPAVSRLGDKWLLGEHVILNQSSTVVENLETLMDGELAQMVLTDSPYNVKISGHVSGLGKHKHREFAQASGEMSEDEFIAFQVASTTTLAQFCHDGALLYLFMDWRSMWPMLSGIRAAKLKMVNLAVWDKGQGSMGSLYRSQHELCFIAKKGSAPSRNNVMLGKFGRNRTNCWRYDGMAGFSRDRDELLASHPTPKNLLMCQDAIRDVTHRGEIVLDGFLGSGTTLVAAERTGRRCYGLELDPLYVDGIIRRWEKLTGRQAVLAATGEQFDTVAALRRPESEEPTESVSVRPPIVARDRRRAA
jgi:DNA modification methylase